MINPSTEQRILVAIQPNLINWITGFLRAKKSKHLAEKTITSYQAKIRKFAAFCSEHGIVTIETVDATLIREFLIYLEENGHNPGGVKGHYTTLKIFLKWYEMEAEPDGWRNPIRKVEAPQVPEELIDPVPIEDVVKIVGICDSSKRGIRDKAMLMALLDTGVRAFEFIAFDLADYDPIRGMLKVKHGKGGKWRNVFVGSKTRRAIRAYLKVRGDKPGALFLTKTKERFRYNGLRSMLRRRAAEAGVTPLPALHGFRRAFTLAMLRNKTDLITLQRLTGHSDVSILKRYAKQLDEDLQLAHAENGPVDRAGF